MASTQATLAIPMASAAASRPVSVAVHSSTAASSTPTHPRRQRASHTVTSSQQDDSSSNSPYTDVYHHPAVEAYMAAHPRRTIPRFGPYLLLQTLGEGEFGKVKLGIHVQWGEEVAVKLIRRGNVDNAVRLSKVEREIEVLRTLKHPNIVRLYDVIETDKYIGIILEYASGGELFDHILAHRYLKEKDAAKLFSQLISGVWYIHQKKIVHRDLKLENLLLDRNRNVIITDFGFANRFEHKADDLMQTSCGSPCYAAPELVISEGLYVGSAVDIWSCGVILYAMLAGYLPFDDDPANPDGDNINLLYKYIVSTPLSFPDYISAEARDLLSMMLVPDPTRRANLDSVMRHPWLSVHSGTTRTDGVPHAFGKTVEELERAALDQHQQRRLAYQRQMRAAALAQGTTNPTGTTTTTNSSPPVPTSSSSSHRHGREATHPGVPNRSHSTQPEHLIYTSTDQSQNVHHAASLPPGRDPQGAATPATPNGSAVAQGKKPAYGSPSAHGITSDDPFGPPPTSSLGVAVVVAAAGSTMATSRISEEKPPGGQVNGGATAPAAGNTTTSTSKGHKQNNSGGASGFERHTIQLEYDGQRNRRNDAERRGGRGSSTGDQHHTPQVLLPPQPQALQPQPQQSAKERRASAASASSKPLPASPPPATTGAGAGVTASPPKNLPAAPPVSASASVPPQPPSKVPTATSGGRPNTVSLLPQQKPKDITTSATTGSIPDTHTIPVSETTSTILTSTTSATAKDTSPSSKDKEKEKKEEKDKETASTASAASSFSRKTGGHKKGQSSVDRFGFVKIFGGGSSNNNGATNSPATPGAASSRVPSAGSTGAGGVKNASAASLLTASPEKDITTKEKEKEKEKEKDGTRGRNSRRNTLTSLTVMVEPLRSTIRGRSGKSSGGSGGNKSATLPPEQPNTSAASLAPPTQPSQQAPSTPAPVSVSTKGSHSAGSVTEGGSTNAGGGTSIGGAGAESGNESGMPASTSKARKVMAWFRTKSKGGRDSMGIIGVGGGSTASPVTFEEPQQLPQQQGGDEEEGGGQVLNVPHPALTLTTPTSTTTKISPPVAGVPQTPVAAVAAAPGHPKRSASATTDHSVMTFSTPGFVQKFRNSVTVGGSSGSGGSTSKSPHRRISLTKSQPQQPQQQQTPKHPHEKLRIHHGAVDQTTITTRPPAEVMKHVREILEGMGMEIMLESEFKYRCVRQKRKKGVVGVQPSQIGGPPAAAAAGAGAAGAGVNGGVASSPVNGQKESDVAAFTMVGSAASNGVDKRGLPMPSQTSFGGTGNMLRGLLMRRQSSQVSAVSPTHHQSPPGLAFDDENSVVISPSTPTSEGLPGTVVVMQETTYGDPTQDAGDEVRFSVELTRIDRLNHMFSLDIRRLKGNLRSYKFLYDTIRQRADLQRLGQ